MPKALKGNPPVNGALSHCAHWKGNAAMKISQVMTRNVQVVRPDVPIKRVAELMDELNVGALPVCDGKRLQGMVTDRDIVVRAVSAGMDPATTPVSEVMTGEIRWCYEDATTSEVMD